VLVRCGIEYTSYGSVSCLAGPGSMMMTELWMHAAHVTVSHAVPSLARLLLFIFTSARFANGAEFNPTKTTAFLLLL